jgi:hypothetical protein
MMSSELNGEVAGLISRLQHRVTTDPKMASVLGRDTKDQSRDLILSGIEDAIIGLVMLHVQVRRELSRNPADS